ncbi:MAG: hypothetical protein ACJ8R9_14690 [Steroidobacteraceae bacterium]
MWLILGSSLDDEPRRLAEQWACCDVSVEVVTPADLSRPGWRLRIGRPVDLQAGLRSQVVRGDDIRAVVNLLPWVSVHDLPHIDPDDREYVANEVAAFLLAWLSELDRPMIDRPTPLSLAGCGRWPAQWAALAKQVGIHADTQWSGPRAEVTVLQGRAVACSHSDKGLAGAAEEIARAGRRSLVTLYFAAGQREPVLIGAAIRPAAGSPAVAEKLFEWLGSQ